MKRDEGLTVNRHRRQRRVSDIGALAVVTMLLGGCGGGDGSSSADTAASLRQTTAQQSSQQTAGGSQAQTQAQSQAQTQTANQTYIDPVAYSANATDGLAASQA